LRIRNVVAVIAVLGMCLLQTACGTSGSSGGGDPGGGVAPTITTQPKSQTVTAGQNVTFSVVATGTGSLSYQWQKNNSNISGGTAASYTFTAESSDNNATFRVVVSDSTGSTTSNTATLTVNAAAAKPTITTQPANLTVTAGQTATFTVVATATGQLTYQWQKGSTNPANISGATSATYTFTTASTDNGDVFRVVVSDSAGSTTSNTATLTVNTAQPPPPSSVSVLTYHNDNQRTGLNANETILTTSNVNQNTFGKLGFMAVDGLVDAEPLYVSNLTVAGAAHNVLFVATEHDSVYAFDADTFAQLWKVTVLGSGETSSDDRGCGQVEPEIGITSTPVIDLKAGTHGTIFVVAMSKNGATYFQRLHALDITNGAEQNGSPTTITATFPGIGANSSGGHVIFDPSQYKERSALLLLNGVIYTTWASHCDADPYTAWLMAYSESTFQQTSVLNITPNGTRGAFWGAGAGPSADTSGNFYVLSGNGTFDDTLDSNMLPVNADFGNGFLKISTANNTMAVADYFNMSDTDTETANDTDLGSGGSMVLPDLKDSSGNTWHLAVGAGKDGRIYVVNRDVMGKFNTSNDNAIYQELDNALPGGVWSTSAYFKNAVYYGPQGSNLRMFTISNAKLSTTPSSTSGNAFGYPGATPSISANGTSNGIVWAMLSGSTGVLYAFDATNLGTMLYNSNQAPNSRDQYSTNTNCKFVTPVIANGKVYVPTATGVVVFGLLGQ
jgi:Immunoglobulin domain/Immunoglobulin I-set domain